MYPIQMDLARDSCCSYILRTILSSEIKKRSFTIEIIWNSVPPVAEPLKESMNPKLMPLLFSKSIFMGSRWVHRTRVRICFQKLLWQS